MRPRSRACSITSARVAHGTRKSPTTAGVTGALAPVAEAPSLGRLACLERVHHACREEPATPIMRSLQGIVRVLHAGYCHASGQPLRRTLSFHQRFHRHRAHKRGGHQCGACTILVEIRADERCAGLIGVLGRMCGCTLNGALLWRTHPTTSCTGETRATPQPRVPAPHAAQAAS